MSLSILYEEGETLTSVVNDMLEAAGLPQVADVSKAPQHSDAGMALKTYYRVMRQTQARGWWFNREMRQPFEPSVIDGSITIPGALNAKTSPPLPGEFPAPDVVLRDILGGGIMTVINAVTRSTEWADTLCLDVVYLKLPDEVPQECKDYCLAKATRLFAAKFGIKVDPFDEQMAWDLLDKAEAFYTPDPTFALNPSIFRQVHR